MKTVARFNNPHEAHFFRSQLEGSGIEAIIVDEHTVQTDWLLSNAIGGVKVAVHEEDFQRATELYQEHRGIDEAEAHEANKKKHGFGRYVLFASITFLIVLVFLILRKPPNELTDIAEPLTSAILLGGAIGLILGMLDL